MGGADRPPSPGASTRLLRLGAGALLVALGGGLATTAAMQGPAGAGAPSPDKTIPTLPPASGEVPATVIDTSVTESTVTGSTDVAAPASTIRDVDTGIPLRAGAGPSELLAAASRALESDTDIAAGLGGFAVIPTGIPTPAGASIDMIEVSYSADLESYVASAEFTTPADADDVVVYYQTVLTAAGFSPTRDETLEAVHELEFAPTGSGWRESVVRLSIDSTDGVAVDIEITAHADPAALEAFAGWPAGLPGLKEGRPTEAHITATSAGGTTVSLSTTFAYDGTSADALTTLIRSGLASGGGGFGIAEGDEGGATIALTHRIIRDAAAEITDVDGATLLRIDGSIASG